MAHQLSTSRQLTRRQAARSLGAFGITMGLLGPACRGKTKVMRMADLDEQCREAQMDELFIETHVSEMVLLRPAAIGYLYCSSRINLGRRSYTIGTPYAIGRFDAANASLLELEEIRPSVLGGPPSPATLGSPVRKGSGEARPALRARLHAAYDALAPPFFAKDRPPPGAVSAFEDAFDLLAEEPLVPYYRALAADFFDWIA